MQGFGQVSLRKRAFALVALMIALIFAGLQWVEAADSLSWGSKGDQVSAVQRKLKQWGYYTGTVDGVYGQSTYSAVISFQKKNGLKADGVVGSSTAKAMGVQLTGGATPQKTVATSGQSTSEVQLLARLINGEARGEPYVGQVAVGAVVLNRVRSSSFPNTISGVVYQPGAFDCVADGQINLTPSADCVRAARDAMNGWDPSGGCLYYYNPQTATSEWIWTRSIQLSIGKHNFSI